MGDRKPEVWLRGPVPGVPGELQPVAHALLQALEDVRAVVAGLPEEILWNRPAGVASAGFHLRHMAGVVDRLFSYARGDSLDEHQMLALRGEAARPESSVTAADLLVRLDLQIDGAIEALRRIDPATLGDFRGVGRQKLPSTVRGLLFHAAEHVQRHTGQLLVTVRIQTAQQPVSPPEGG